MFLIKMYICRCPKCGIFQNTPFYLREHLRRPHNFAGNGKPPNLASLEKYVKTTTLKQGRQLSKRAQKHLIEVCEMQVGLAELKIRFCYP